MIWFQCRWVDSGSGVSQRKLVSLSRRSNVWFSKTSFVSLEDLIWNWLEDPIPRFGGGDVERLSWNENRFPDLEEEEVSEVPVRSKDLMGKSGKNVSLLGSGPNFCPKVDWLPKPPKEALWLFMGERPAAQLSRELKLSLASTNDLEVTSCCSRLWGVFTVTPPTDQADGLMAKEVSRAFDTLWNDCLAGPRSKVGKVATGPIELGGKGSCRLCPWVDRG